MVSNLESSKINCLLDELPIGGDPEGNVPCKGIYHIFCCPRVTGKRDPGIDTLEMEYEPSRIQIKAATEW